MLIGITGNIGSGKTRVAHCLGSLLGAAVLNADEICRELLEPGAAGYRRFASERGREFLNPDGRFDRGRLRKALFQDRLLRGRLEEILHPLVRRRMLELARQQSAGGADLIAEVPLLFESGWEEDFDLIIAVTADPVVAESRVLERDGGSAQSFRKIRAAQLDQQLKASRADLTIDNSGSWDETAVRLRQTARDIAGRNKPMEA